MKIDIETAELIVEFIRLMHRAKTKTGKSSNKPLREFIYFYIECQFYNKEAMKREYAAKHGVTPAELDYDHPFPLKRMAKDLFTMNDTTPEAIQSYFADLPAPRILTRLQHAALPREEMPPEYDDPLHVLYKNKMARYLKAGLS